MKKSLKHVLLSVLLIVSFVINPAKADFHSAYNFSHIDNTDGLSHNQVHSLMQDSRGFLWVGTLSGLNRLDGNGIKIFKSGDDTISLCDNNVYGLFESPDGKIWIKTTNSWNVFDPVTETFSLVLNVTLGDITFPSLDLNRVFVDCMNRCWFTTLSHGVICKNDSLDKVTQLIHDDNNDKSLSSGYYSGIVDDSDGNIWVISNFGVLEKIDKNSLTVIDRIELAPQESNVTYFNLFIDKEGLLWVNAMNNALGAYVYNPENGSVKHFSTTSSKYRVTSDIITQIIQDDNGVIWIATDHGGINLFDKETDSFMYLKHDPFNQSSISADNVVSLELDRQGTMWVGTFRDGIDCFHKDAFLFNTIKDNPINANDINDNDITCITEDKNGYIWFGSNGKGLVGYDRLSGRFSHFRNDKSNANSLSNDVIVSMTVDNENKLWIGTYFGGLNCFDGKRFNHYRYDKNNHESLSDDRVFSVLEDSKNNIWVGTLGGGLNLLNNSNNVFYHFREGDINSVRSDFIMNMEEDNKGNIWIATAVGLSRFIVETGRFVFYQHEDGNPRSLSNSNIQNICVDKNGELWIGTREGLNHFNYETNDFDVIKTEHGLPDNYICSLVGDTLGNLWVTTPYHLLRLIWPASDTVADVVITQYDELDGLQSGEFNVNSAYCMQNGDIYIGGTKGVTYFSPNQIKKEISYKNQLVITGFSLFNKPISIGEDVDGRVLFEKSFYEVEEIVLKHDENVFSIEFSDLSFLRNDTEHFFYKMDGFNSDWIELEKDMHSVQFANLSPGEYQFVIRKAEDINSSDYVEKELTVIIKTPFWKSRYAYIFYFLFIIGALLLVREIVLTRERIKTESEMEKRSANMQREMDMMKLRFFTNISHELKTPLSLILSPIEDLLKESTNTKQYNQLQLIHRNALRLFNMVNQLLDFRKMEAQKVELVLSDGDIVSFVRNAVDSFVDMANKKDISLDLKTQYSQLFVSFDKRKIERILFNLLSNAFKFTPGNGHVIVEINSVGVEQIPTEGIEVDRTFDTFIELRVEDNGIGISPENKQLVFERFFQENKDSDKYNEGSGIGLSITKEYSRLMGGDVTLVSEKGKGTTFLVYIPLRQNKQTEESINREQTEEEFEMQEKDERPTLLIVEDNDDFRSYLNQSFNNQYNIIEAADGGEGLKQAVTIIPDLIVSDVMMPVMDGIEMCRKVKSDVRTSHIPVILLTAVNNQEKMLEGFEIGADDYVTKPFNPDILASRIHNLINQREKLHRNFKMQMKLEPKEVSVTSLDEKIINKAIEIVEKNIANPDFSVTELSGDLGMSRVNLYKKLKSLTGHTPIEFIRTFRIKRAAQLLSKSQMSVSEVAYQVGFNDPRYFTRYFKAEFNMLPSEYARKNKSISDENIKKAIDKDLNQSE